MACVFENIAPGSGEDRESNSGYYGAGFAGEGSPAWPYLQLGVGLRDWTITSADGYLNDCYSGKLWDAAIYIKVVTKSWRE